MLLWVQASLRGISQIFFVNNWISGLLILIAVGIYDLHMAFFMLLGSVVQMLVGITQRHGDIAKDGLMGFNGALVGAFTGFAHLPLAMQFLATILGAMACVPLHDVFTWLFSLSGLRRAKLPVSTAPFCTAAGVLTILTTPFVNPEAIKPAETIGHGFLYTLGNSFAEVVLVDGWVSGLLIIIALFIGDRMIGVFGLLGMVIAAFAAFFIEGADTAASGLQEYSAVLVAIALGAVFWNDKKLSVRIIAAILAALVTIAVEDLLELTPIPVYTWPFLITMWIFMLAGSKLGRSTTVKLKPAHER